jgi:hypothetical protein
MLTNINAIATAGANTFTVRFGNKATRIKHIEIGATGGTYAQHMISANVWIQDRDAAPFSACSVAHQQGIDRIILHPDVLVSDPYILVAYLSGCVAGDNIYIKLVTE